MRPDGLGYNTGNCSRGRLDWYPMGVRCECAAGACTSESGYIKREVAVGEVHGHKGAAGAGEVSYAGAAALCPVGGPRSGTSRGDESGPDRSRMADAASGSVQGQGSFLAKPGCSRG